MIQADAFKQFIASHLGCEPPARIEPGRFVRFPTNGKRTDDAGWAKLFPDCENGVVGNFRSGEVWTWQAERSRPPTEAEQRVWRERVDRERHEAQAVWEREEVEAAQRAKAIWEKAQPAPSTHLYLKAKRVQAHGLRLYRGPLAVNGMRCDGALIVPLRNAAGELQTLEFIAPDGGKRFLPRGLKASGYYAIGERQGTHCIAEGFATAASIHAATGYAVAAAMDAGNLLPVAKALRAKFPDGTLILCADDDAGTEGNPGITKATEAALAVGGLLAVPDFGADRPDGATDFNDMAQLCALKAVERAIASASASAPARGEPQPGRKIPLAAGQHTADAETIARLAALDPLDYDRVRAGEAERLGVRVQTLDEQVKLARGNGADDEGKLMFAEIEPWPDPVDGGHLLDSLAASCRRFIVLPPHGGTAIALWVLFTYLIEVVEVAVILAAVSPEKRCGKTTLLDLLSRLVRRPMPASNISPAALFRSVEKWGPTLLVDEADSFLKDNDELRGILNSGHTRSTAYVIRSVGDDHEPTKFCTWGAKTIALIGRLPDTLHDRSIVIELRRKLQSERVEKLRHAEPGKFEILARQCVRFATDNAAKIKSSRPAIPDELHDRAADNWEPLFIIADVAGGEWPKRARQAASVLSGATADGDSTKTELLRDVRAIFGRTQTDRISSAGLAEALAADAGARWCEYNRGKPITQRQLARLLRPFAIVPNSVRLDDGSTPKGYLLEGFADAFNRYAPLLDPQHRHKPVLARVSGENASATDSGALRIENTRRSSTGAACGGVADRNPSSGAEDGSEVF